MAKPTFTPTAEQQAVIDHRGSHLQVIACAGAGKTEAISRRVCSLIEGGVEPGQIIAFTFTERAAESLKTRITRRIAEAKGEDYLDKLNPMYIGTIHAYCLRMLTDHVPEFGNYDILDENRLAGLLSREYKRLELNELGDQHWRPIRDFLRNSDVMENELLDPKTINTTPFGKCYIAFKEMLFRYHFLSYGLLISAAVKALDRPEVFARVHGPLRHLIVDEYQDINPAQERLIARLAENPVELCVVADDDQAIYQWRGSDVSHMQGFKKRYKATTLTLSENRRSRPEIIESANTFANSISPRLDKKMKPCRPAGGLETHAWAAETPEAEACVIAETIEKLHKRGYRYKDIAVLFRSTRTSAPPLLAELKDRDIPVRCAGRTGLFLQPDATVLGQTYAWLTDSEWKSDRYGKSAPVKLDDLVKEYQRLFNKGKAIPELKPYLEDWKGSVKKTFASVNLVRDFYKLLNLLGVHDIDPDDPVGSARLGTLARFSQILADYEHVKRRARYVEETGGKVFKSGQDRGEWFYRQLFNYLQYYALDAYEDFEGEETFDYDAVDILTVHQAKGLEWPVVFLPSLVSNRFPAKKAGQAQEWLIPESVFTADARERYQGGEMEERRLFYVALTRARDMIYLSCFQKINNKFQPSPFLVEVAGEPKEQKKLPLPEAFTPPTVAREDLPTISFSELAHYEECPLRLPLPHRPEPGPMFHLVCRKLAFRLAKLAGLDAVGGVKFDEGNYDKVRLWRLVNSRHAKTGLHKVKMSYEELMGLSAEGVRSLAVAPRPFLAIDPTAVAEPQLERDWEQAAEAVAREYLAKAARRMEDAAAGGPDRLNRATLDFIANGAANGDRHRLLYSASRNLAEFGCPARLAFALLMPAALDAGLAPGDATRQIECGLKDTASPTTEGGCSGG